MMPMKIVQFSRSNSLHPLVHLRPKFFLDLGRPISNEPPPSPNDIQSVKRKHNPRMTIICYQVLPSGRLLSILIASLILSGFPLTYCHLAQGSLSAFSLLYTLWCAVVQKYHKMSFIYNYSHFWYSFCNQPVLFSQLENKTKHVTFKLTTRSIFPFSSKTM